MTTTRTALKNALLNLGKRDYEIVRENAIAEWGYDQFRDIQSALFREIVTEEKQKLTGVGFTKQERQS